MLYLVMNLTTNSGSTLHSHVLEFALCMYMVANCYQLQ